MSRWPEVIVIALVLVLAGVTPYFVRRDDSARLQMGIVGNVARPMPAVATPMGPADPPEPAVLIDESVVPVAIGNYCWRSGNSESCSEGGDPLALATMAGLTAVAAPAATVTIDFPFEPSEGSLGLGLWDGKQFQPVTVDPASSFQAPAEVGRYIYDLSASWPQGAVGYVFVIEVHDEKVQAPALLVKIGGQAVPTVRGGSCWSGTPGEALCTDTLSPAEQLKSLPSLTRVAGALVEISFTRAPERFEVYRRNGDQRDLVALTEGGSFALPKGPFEQVYEVDAQWPEGSGSYGFKVGLK